MFIIQFGSGYGWMDCSFGGVRGDMWFMVEYRIETRKVSWLIFTSVGLVDVITFNVIGQSEVITLLFLLLIYFVVLLFFV